MHVSLHASSYTDTHDIDKWDLCSHWRDTTNIAYII